MPLSMFFFLLPSSLSAWRTSTHLLELRSTITLIQSPPPCPFLEQSQQHVYHIPFYPYYFSFSIPLVNPLNFQESLVKESWLCPENETFPKDPSSMDYTLSPTLGLQMEYYPFSSLAGHSPPFLCKTSAALNLLSRDYTLHHPSLLQFHSLAHTLHSYNI